MLSQTQQCYLQTQQLTSSPPLISQQQLAALPSQRLALYQHSLIQQAPIHITPDGSFSSLSPTLRDSLHLLTPSNPFAEEAAQFLQSSNEFLIPISTIPLIFKTKIQHFTHLTILFGPPNNPDGGSAELFPLLALPSLTHLRLIFQDRPSKGVGPSLWLQPCIAFILRLQDEKRISLRLELKTGDVEELKDVTKFLNPLSGEEEAVVREARRRVDAYRGPSPSYVTILVVSGWDWEVSERVVGEWMCRSLVREWIEEERRREDLDMDVEMVS